MGIDGEGGRTFSLDGDITLEEAKNGLDKLTGEVKTLHAWSHES